MPRGQIATTAQLGASPARIYCVLPGASGFSRVMVENRTNLPVKLGLGAVRWAKPQFRIGFLRSSMGVNPNIEGQF